MLYGFQIKSNQIYIFVPSLHYIENKIFIKHIYENLRRGGIESQGLFQSQEKFLESVNSVKSDKPKKCLLKMFEKTETEILLVILRSGN